MNNQHTNQTENQVQSKLEHDTALMLYEIKKAGIDIMDDHFISVGESETVLDLAFHHPADANEFITIATGMSCGLRQRILQDAHENNWEYCIHPVEINDDRVDPDFYFVVCVAIPETDMQSVTNNLHIYNHEV